MTMIMVDVEADGPCPGHYSMIELGAVVVERGKPRTFYGTLAPITQQFKPDALKAIGRTREETLQFDNPAETMHKFKDWLDEVNKGGRPIFISDNNGFDWQFVNFYFHAVMDTNPFGHSSRNLQDLYKGMTKNMRKNCKHLRKTKHTHHPVDDAMGNVEALIAMAERGLHVPSLKT